MRKECLLSKVVCSESMDGNFATYSGELVELSDISLMIVASSINIGCVLSQDSMWADPGESGGGGGRVGVVGGSVGVVGALCIQYYSGWCAITRQPPTMHQHNLINTNSHPPTSYYF